MFICSRWIRAELLAALHNLKYVLFLVLHATHLYQCICSTLLGQIRSLTVRSLARTLLSTQITDHPAHTSLHPFACQRYANPSGSMRAHQLQAASTVPHCSAFARSRRDGITLLFHQQSLSVLSSSSSSSSGYDKLSTVMYSYFWNSWAYQKSWNQSYRTVDWQGRADCRA